MPSGELLLAARGIDLLGGLLGAEFDIEKHQNRDQTDDWQILQVPKTDPTPPNLPPAVKREFEQMARVRLEE